MTTGALILFVAFCVAVGCFGLYAGLHVDNDNGKNNKKQNHA